MRGGMVLAFAVSLSLPVVISSPAESVSGSGSYDTFEAYTFNDVTPPDAPVPNAEIPYTGSTQVEYVTPTIDTSAFTVQPGEADESGNLNGCLEDPPVFAGRTAWVRFNPGVAGTITVLATTPGYDSVLMLREAAKVTWGTTQLSDLAGRPSNCADVDNDQGSETTTLAARADRAYYVQVGGKCPTSSPTSCSDAAVPGGSTIIRLTFTPSDTDGDGVPDTQDQCQGEGVAGSVNSEGCPDDDHDGTANVDDACPDRAGDPENPVPPPWVGCPPGPTPPAGVARVTITALDGDPLNTNKPQVRLVLDWPQGTQQAFADNGIGDVPTAIDFAGQPVAWTLPATRKSESREVNVRFVGPGIDVTVDDQITLDTQAPTLPKSVVLPPAFGDWYAGFKATDGATGSGVTVLSLLDRKKKPLGSKVTCTKLRCKSIDGSRSTSRRPVFARVLDAAGNARTVRLDTQLRGCTIRVPYRNPPTAYDCFRLGDSCAGQKGLFDWKSQGLRCRGGVVRRRL
jgi:hypothetical protein